MSATRETLPRPLEEAMAVTRRVAAAQGYALAEGECGPNVLVFKKGVKLLSWGSAMTVEFAKSTADETELTITTQETFAITDWGRGKRAVQKLLDAVNSAP